jgi:hypothetical protein
MVVLDGNFVLERITPKYIYRISMYAITNRCSNVRGLRTNYVRSTVPQCILISWFQYFMRRK